MTTSTHNRLALILSTLFMCVSVLFLPQFSLAFFSDTETSASQRFGAAELLFSEDYDDQELQVGPGLATSHEFVLPVSFTTSSVSNKYDVSVTFATGHVELCDALALQTTLGAESSTGYFESFASAPYSEVGEVVMSVLYDDTKRAIPHNATCTAEVAVEAWQEGMSKATAGYRDKKTFSITITAQMVVLNEVLARPNTIDTQVPNVEFIELYNNSDFPLDVLGFNITELTAGGVVTNHFIANIATAPASALIAYNGSLSTIVPAHGHLALKYRGSSSYLNDSGDTIALIDTGTNEVIDLYSYGAAVIGKSDARIPDGVGAWIDPIPTPNQENIAEEYVEVVQTATTTVFADLEVSEEQEISTSTDTVEEEVEVVEDEAASTTAEEVEEEEEIMDPVAEEEVVEEEETAPADTEEVDGPVAPVLPFSDTNDAENALLDPEPAAKTSEEEIEVVDAVVETPPVT
jgi:hypothetical protein